MKKRELAGALARQAHLSQAAAADQLDKVIHDILKQIRQGKPAALPGLGKFTSGGFEFEKRPKEKR